MLDLVELLEWLDNAGVAMDPEWVQTNVKKIACVYNADKSVHLTIEIKSGGAPWPANVRDARLMWQMD